MSQNKQLASFDDAQKDAKTLPVSQRKPTLDLLKDVHEFVETNKIQCEYRLAIKEDDLEHSGIVLGKIVMPKTLLNFLLTKYVQQSKPKQGSKKPTAHALLGMLLKHQNFNAAFEGNELKCMFATGTFKPKTT